MHIVQLLRGSCFGYVPGRSCTRLLSANRVSLYFWNVIEPILIVGCQEQSSASSRFSARLNFFFSAYQAHYHRTVLFTCFSFGGAALVLYCGKLAKSLRVCYDHLFKFSWNTMMIQFLFLMLQCSVHSQYYCFLSHVACGRRYAIYLQHSQITLKPQIKADKTLITLTDLPLLQFDSQSM